MVKLTKLRGLGKKVALGATLAVASVSSFAETIDVSSTVTEITEAKAPIAAVAGASLGAYVSIRIWKLVRRAI